jgi:hypothetical protein
MNLLTPLNLTADLVDLQAKLVANKQTSERICISVFGNLYAAQLESQVEWDIDAEWRMVTVLFADKSAEDYTAMFLDEVWSIK